MTTFDDIDDESAAMILQLQIEDSDEIFAQLEGNGKRPEGLLSDDQLAFQILKEELERDAATLKDRQMTKSIADACRTDGNILTATQSEEQTAANDHEIACRLAGTQLPAPIQPWTITAEQIDEELLAKLSALYVSVPTESDFSELEGTNKHSDSESGDAESSAWAATRTNPKALSRRCTVCYENVRFFDTARVPCGHEYCRECLQDLYRASMTDDSLFPPRCCKQPITSGGVRIFLTSDIIAQYEQKKIEVETPDRTYCSNPTCSVFIRSANIVGDQGTCSVCTTTTCTICKAASHTGDCPSDTALAQLLETANENGWQRCFSCRSVVDLEIGCNHITCRCGAQFCYVCGTEWRQCQCDQWNEDRLLARAAQVVARRPLQADPPQRGQIEAAVENLRTRHNCDHQRWQYVGGPHRCEECYHHLPSYIFECRQCNIQACNRCRRNRL